MSPARTRAACLAASFGDTPAWGGMETRLTPYGQRLLDFNFYRPEQPRRGPCAHVKAWEREYSIRALVAYNNSPVFHDAVIARRKANTMRGYDHA